MAKRHATRLGTRGRRTQGGGRCQYLCANPVAQRADDRQTLYEHHVDGRFSPAGVLGLKAKRGTLESKMIVIGGHVGEEETVRPTRKAWITLGNAQTVLSITQEGDQAAEEGVQYLLHWRASVHNFLRSQLVSVPDVSDICAQRALNGSWHVPRLGHSDHELPYTTIFLSSCAPTAKQNHTVHLFKLGLAQTWTTPSSMHDICKKPRAHRQNRQRQQWCRAIPTQQMLCDCESASDVEVLCARPTMTCGSARDFYD